MNDPYSPISGSELAERIAIAEVEIARQQAIRRAKDRVLDLAKGDGVVDSKDVGKKLSVASAGQEISQVEIDNILLIA
jgi:hypothetical protein